MLSHTRTHTPHATGEAREIHLPETLRPAPIEQKPLPADTALPSFSSERPVVSLHLPQPPSKRRGVGGGHAYRCCASSQHSNHDDNPNDDDDKDDDSEECCLTEHLTPDSP